MKIYILGLSLFMAALGGFFYPHYKGNIETRNPSSVKIPEDYFVNDLDKDLGEHFEDNDSKKEQKYITGIADTFLKFIVDVQNKSKSQTSFRGAHAKALACLKGEFSIRNQLLPENLRVGLFAKNSSYRTWLRISNSSQDPFSKDKDQNTRGFAMKLTGVRGEKLLGESSNTLDFLTVASEAFVAKDLFNYSDIADGKESAIGLATRLGFQRTKDLLKAVSTAKKESNPLRLQYFSTVPYRLGLPKGPKAAIKFRVQLCDGQKAGDFPASTDGPENLISNISKTIQANNQICYNFQIQQGTKRDDVEDATTSWPGKYETVATITISKDLNGADEILSRKEFCENLSFNPWRTLEEHRPLGRINRARKTTYLMSSDYRHHENRARTEEPDDKSFDRVH